MSSFLGVPVDAAYHLVSGLTGVLTPVLGGLAAVAAIVAFTMAVRLLLMPLSLRALRGQAAQARLAPHLVALRQRYGKQPERLQREMTALYKREGTSMFAGFAPLLLQFPNLAIALQQAATLAQPGDVVVLSPACASYDQYPHYEARGEHFRTLAQAL